MNIKKWNKIAGMMLVALFASMPINVLAVDHPGFHRAHMSAVTPEESGKSNHSRKLPPELIQPKSSTAINTVSLASASVSTPIVPYAIIELANALRNDPDLIYEYVRNNIEYYPIWGVQKGPAGTILDESGTAFDQASLMVALLRQAGFTASYVKGQINVTAAQIKDWLGIGTSNACAVWRLLSYGGVRVASINENTSISCPGTTEAEALVSAKMSHIWVKVNIGGTNYVFDPSFKSHTLKVGINLTAATQYDATSYLATAMIGANVSQDPEVAWVEKINQTNIRSNLTTYANE